MRKKLRDLERVGEPETFSVGGVAGLCVVWKSPANAQWLVRLRVDGKPKNVSLGGLKSMGLKEAREIALYVREHGGQLPVESAPEVVEEKHTDSVAKLWPQWRLPLHWWQARRRGNGAGCGRSLYLHSGASRKSLGRKGVAMSPDVLPVVLG